MANSPRGTRNRDGAAQLSQFRQEFRLFDEANLGPISAVLEVWNEPVVIHVFGLANGQTIAVDNVSNFDSGTPVYTPFTPTRGTPLILDNDLTSVVLFYSGRYVLRLAGPDLGTVKAFAYPFSVSHDWGDYYGGLGSGGDVVRSIDEVDTNTINITLVPDPGVGDVTIRADAILSPNAGNILTFLGNGMYTPGPNNGTITVVPTSVLDTTSIDMTLAANVLSAVVIRSPFAGQILQLRADGVYVPGPQLGDPTAVPTSVLDTTSIDLTLAANVLSAVAIISPDAGNSLAIRANGLYSTGFAGTITSADDTNTIDHTVAVGVLTSAVIRSPDVGNLIELRANGVYSGVGTAVTSVVDTLSIDHTLASNILQSDLRIDPNALNQIVLGAPGVIVLSATTAEEEAEAAGKLVITSSVLGHIVNARTAQRSSHLGVAAGNLATDQVSVGYQAGLGVSAAQNIAIGASSGQNNSGVGNIVVGTSAGNTTTGIGNIRIGNSSNPGAGQNYNIYIGEGVAAPVIPTGFNIAIGYQVAVSNVNMSAITSIGNRASYQANYSLNAVGGGQTAMGQSAGYDASTTNTTSGNIAGNFFGTNSGRLANHGGLTAVGDYAGYNASGINPKYSDGAFVGSFAGADAFGIQLDGGESNKQIAAVGNYTLNGARGAGSAGKAPNPAEDLGDYYTVVGPYAAQETEGMDYIAIGAQSARKSAMFDSIIVGNIVGYHSSIYSSTVVGNLAAMEANLDRVTVLGYGAYAATYTGVALVTFNQAAINTVTNIFTTGAHGLTVGTYVTLRFNTVAGGPINGLTDGTAYAFFVDSATTLRLAAWTVTNPLAVPAGTYRLEAQNNKYFNISVIGHTATATANNQVTLGNDATTQMRTAGAVFPGDDSGGFQATAGIYGGAGVPNNANGADGNFYLRSDGLAANTTVYHKRAGAWVGIV